MTVKAQEIHQSKFSSMQKSYSKQSFIKKIKMPAQIEFSKTKPLSVRSDTSEENNISRNLA